MNIKLLLFAALLCLGWSLPASANDLVTTTPAPLSARDKSQAADESKQGADASAEVNKAVKMVKDKAITDRVNTIGQKIAAIANVTTYPALYGNDKTFPFTWHFFVIDEKDVNAFSLPGGYVYVNSGLLKFVRSDDELAGVLAHEITHAAHHHIQSLSHEQSKMNTEMIAGLLAAIVAHVNPRDMANLAAGAQYTQMGILNTRYSQAAERDADHGGTILLQKAGYNPVAMLTFMQRLSGIEARSPKIEMGILMDHPYTTERVGLINTELAAMNVSVTTQAVRQVTDAPHAVVHPAPSGGEDIVFANRTLPTLSDPDMNRTAAFVTKFNSLLDGGLQMYQIAASGDQVLISDKPLLTITPADVALHPGQTSQSLAKAASDALRSGIYAQSFASSSRL